MLVDENLLYVEDGRIITSAGTAAGIDACLHLVRVEFGAKVAAAIARDMVVPPHRDGGQALYIDRPIPQCGSEPMEQLLQWMVRHLEEEHAVNELAARVHMSPRNLRGASVRKRGHPGGLAQFPAGAPRPGAAGDHGAQYRRNREGIRLRTFGPVAAPLTKVLDTSPVSYRRTFRGHLATA